MKRKDFLRQIALGSAAAAFGKFSVQAATPLESWLNLATDTDHVLVIIRMAGGNDGLNTLIPLDQYANYKNARANIAISDKKTIAMNGNTKTAFHPALSEIADLYNDGKVKILQSVGYPNQDYSHFRSTDIWMTAADTDQLLNTGTLGRYLKTEYPNYPIGYPNATMPDPLCIEVGYSQSLIFQGPLTGMGLSITSPNDFYQLIADQQTPAPNTPAGKQLDYVRLIKAQSNQYGDTIKKAYNKVKQQQPYPANNSLAAQLKIVAALIAGGMKTRIYMVTIDGFDTHDTQTEAADTTKGEHADLLKTLSQAMKAFMTDLMFLGAENRVLTMTMSEFGRRIKSNASYGTDHGAAAPMFLFGSAVKSGILGNNPTIKSSVTDDDNVPMQYDFRSVYTTILKEWFCVQNNDLQEIMLKNFQTLPLLKTSNCIPTAVHEANQNAGEVVITTYPNPFVASIKIDFKSKGGQTLIQVYNSAGVLLATPIKTYYPAGDYSATWNSEDLPVGLYYIRYQCGVEQQVEMVMKAR